MLNDDIRLKITITQWKTNQLKAALRNAKRALQRAEEDYSPVTPEQFTNRARNIKQCEEQVERYTRAIKETAWTPPSYSEICKLRQLELQWSGTGVLPGICETAVKVAVMNERPQAEAKARAEYAAAVKVADRAYTAFVNATAKYGIYPTPTWEEAKAELVSKYGLMGVL